jgi:hypothetical protein
VVVELLAVSRLEVPMGLVFTYPGAVEPEPTILPPPPVLGAGPQPPPPPVPLHTLAGRGNDVSDCAGARVCERNGKLRRRASVVGNVAGYIGRELLESGDDTVSDEPEASVTEKLLAFTVIDCTAAVEPDTLSV